MPKPKAETTVLDVHDPFMSINEIAAFLSVTRDMVYKMMDDGRLPYIYVGSVRRVRQSAVKACVAAGS